MPCVWAAWHFFVVVCSWPVLALMALHRHWAVWKPAAFVCGLVLGGDNEDMELLGVAVVADAMS